MGTKIVVIGRPIATKSIRGLVSYIGIFVSYVGIFVSYVGILFPFNDRKPFLNMETFRFQRNGESMERVVKLEDGYYTISVPCEYWNRGVSKYTTAWLHRAKQGNIGLYRHGTIMKTETPIEHTIDKAEIYECSVCHRRYTTRSGLFKHQGKCIPSHPVETVNIRQMTVNHHQTINIQNQIIVRELGKENPRWLTANLLMQAISNIPKAIPTLMEKKHFNENFPENMNLRVDTRKDIDKRLRVFEDGRWRLRDSKQTFYKVLVDIYDVLSDALEDTEDDEDEIDSGECAYTKEQLQALRRSSRFVKKLQKIQPIWDNFRETITDDGCRNELWEDLKTLLLDRQLAIEQGCD